MNIDQIYQELSTQKWFKEKSMDEQGTICIETAKRRDYEIRFLPSLNREQLRLVCDSLNTFGNVDVPADNDTVKYFNVDFVFECLIQAWKHAKGFIRPLIKATVDQLVNGKKCYQAGLTPDEVWIV